MRNAIPAVLLLACSSAVLAEEQAKGCSQTMKDSPMLLGLQLGKTEKEFLTLFPSAKIDKDHVSHGETRYYGWVVVPYNRPVQPVYELVAAQAVDGRLSFFSVRFRKFRPADAESFVRQAAEVFGLPAEGWKKLSEGARLLECVDFSVEVQTGESGERQTGRGSKREEAPAILLTDKG